MPQGFFTLWVRDKGEGKVRKAQWGYGDLEETKQGVKPGVTGKCPHQLPPSVSE